MTTTTTVLAEKWDLKIAVLPIDNLKPHEKGSALYLEMLKQEILKDNVIKYPIIADEETSVILDGMHRWLALKSLGYTLIPTILANTQHKTRIRVGRRRIHYYTIKNEEDMSIQRVILAGLSGRLMEPRTTRHFFPFSKFQQVNLPLDALNKSHPQDVSKYLSRMTRTECKMVINQWLEEIDEELEFLAKRKEETEREKREFLNRVRSFTALVPTKKK